MSRKKNMENEFLEDDDDKKKTGGGSGYVPKQSLDPKIFLNDVSTELVPGIKNDDFCAACFASPLSSCKCGKKVPAPRGSANPTGGSGKLNGKDAKASPTAQQPPPPQSPKDAPKSRDTKIPK